MSGQAGKFFIAVVIDCYLVVTYSLVIIEVLFVPAVAACICWEAGIQGLLWLCTSLTCNVHADLRYVDIFGIPSVGSPCTIAS